jgi:predicted RNase H-like HicB family nuclease
MKYHFKYQKDERGGYWGECVELVGCISQGSNLDELHNNFKEALELYLDEPEDSKKIFPLPNKALEKKKNVMAVEVDPQIALAFLIKQDRLRSGKNQKSRAKELGFKNLYSYQVLENSKKINPEFKTLIWLKKMFPKISFDEILEV